jgi:hypothetical protein
MGLMLSWIRKETEETYFGVKIRVGRAKKFYAQTKLDGEIHIEKSAQARFSGNGLKTLVMHERFHQLWYGNPTNKLATFAGLFVLFGSLAGIAVIVASLFFFKIRAAYLLGLAVLLVYFIAAAFVVLYTKRIAEAAADLYSAKEVGRRSFVSGFRERRTAYPKSMGENSLAGRLLNWRYLFEHRSENERETLVKET